MARKGFSDTDSDATLGRMLPLSGPAEDYDEDEDGERQAPSQRYIYENEAQSKRRTYRCRETYEVAGRGTGKTTDIAEHVKEVSMRIPRSTNVFLGCSVKQLYLKTWPAVVKGLEMMGMVEGRDFMRQRPPAKLHWPMPLSKPRSWENVTIFPTGAAWYSISMAVRASVNGMTLSSAASDETRYLPFQKIKEELFPALRPELIAKGSGLTGDGFRNTAKYTFGYNKDYNPLYLSKFFVSDPAITQKQAVWEQEEQNQTVDINHEIDLMLAEAEEMPELWHVDGFLKRINQLRCQSKIFFRFSSLANIEILGEDWFREMRRSLPDIMYRIQILGQRKGLARDGYYCNFDIDIHGYHQSDMETMDRLLSNYTTHYSRTGLDQAHNPTEIEYEAIDLRRTAKVSDCSLDVDLDYSLPIRLAFDYNANLNCAVLGQLRRFDGRESLMVLKSMFTMNEQKIRALCKNICTYYRPFIDRGGDFIYYFDSTAKQGASLAYAVEGAQAQNFNDVVIEEMRRHGASVMPVDIGAPMKHNQKFQMICDVFSFQQGPAVRINADEDRNEYLITAMENCATEQTATGIRKYKGGEKLKATTEGAEGAIDPRVRTDVTDAFDTLLIGCKFYTNGVRAIGGRLRGRFHNLIIPH